MRFAPLIAALCGLSACANSDAGPSMIKTVWEQVKADRKAAKAPVVKKTPSRAEIDRTGLAIIQMNLHGEAAWPLMFAATVNGPRVTYATKLRQSITLQESQIVATRGLGTDLLGATSSANDPLKKLTAPNRWPDKVTRSYRIAGDGPLGKVLQFNCALQRVGENVITLAGSKIPVVGFVERCDGPSGAFQNMYAADAKTGRVWQSQQFVGPDIAAVNLEILEPVGP